MKKNEKTEVATVNKEATKYLQAMGLAGKLTEPETDQFLEICKAYQLNPFKREIYATKYGDNFSIIVGYETYLKRAERSGKLSGWNVVTQGKVSDNSLKAIVTIYRKDFEHPFIHEVYYYEYVQRKNNGEVTKFWKEKPVTMTKKVAISQAFRMCFSEDLGGMPYTADEVVTQDAVYEIIENAQQKNDEVVNKIKSSQSIDELRTIWSKTDGKIQKQIDVLNAKEEKKNELLTQKENENGTDQK